MDCTAQEMKQLRYRLGYSQAEMARCLHTELANISSFEAGRASVPANLKSEILRIFNQAESNADRAQRRPIAEVIMKARGLSQIPDFDIEL